MSVPLPLNRRLLTGTACAAVAMMAATAPARALVPNEDKTPADLIDNADAYRGVGMFYRADGFVCTGTLINPRTVLFAAHCVSDLPEEEYHRDDVPAAWSFNVNALPGFQNWLANNFASNPKLAVFNVNRIVWNPQSRQDAFGLGFIEADIALASLDTPAVGIPTWALLFSTLPAPATSDPARGTGYHVNIVGYGATGNAVQGAVLGIDWRRRAAENLLGGFFSLDDRDNVIIGPNPPTFPQNLYQIDFDSQDRDVARDFNIYRDDALPNEGITAGGDSGAPLILGAANNSLSNEDLVIGVLSGGSRFFGPSQPFSSLGTTSFYQPLSLYWQYVTANNPYRYVAAKAGNGNWEDGNHWVTQLDPMVRVIDAQGQVVNGLPTTPERGRDATGGEFGVVCPAIGTPDVVCTNLASGEAAAATGTLPAPTLANGLPGASGFVPNNIDPVTTATMRIDPRYFDVTLSQDGTTTLSSGVTIDRLTVRGNAGLTVGAAGDLTALIDINQFGGRVNANGGITSVGDYTLFAGMIEGTGTLTAPFLTNVTGVLSPGTTGTIGTLTIDGNLVLSSGAQFHVDLGSGGVSDRLAVTGIANVGGAVNTSAPVAGRVNGNGERYTIVTGTGGVTGTFTPGSISAIISQRFIYQPNAVLMEFSTASYTTVIESDDPVQAPYAQLLDQNRSNASLASLYALDFAAVDTIRNTFTGLAPVNEQAVRSLSAQSLNLLQNLNAARLREADRARAGGRIAVTGRPLDLAQLSLAPVGQPLGGALMAMQDGAVTTDLSETSLPENVGVFLSGGYVSGNADSLPGVAPKTDISGYVIAGGIEFYPGDNTMVGLSGTYTALEADVPLGQRVESETYAASLYLRHAVAGGPVIDGQFSMGSMGFDTRRTVPFLGTSQTLASASDDLLVSGALGISYDLNSSIGTISPGIEGRFASVDLGTVRESGGTLGLAAARDRFASKQARVGFAYEKRGKGVAMNANAQLVWEFADGPQLLGANFVSGSGPNATFVLDPADHTWGEVGISATVGHGPLQLTVGADTTIGRDNAEAQVFRGTATYRF